MLNVVTGSVTVEGVPPGYPGSIDFKMLYHGMMGVVEDEVHLVFKCHKYYPHGLN